MKVPVLPTIASALCVVLSLWLVIQTINVRSGREGLLAKQDANRKLQQQVEQQNEEAQRQTKVYQATQGIAQLRQSQLQQQQQTVETAKNLDQKVFGPLLSIIGYTATKNNNDKLRELLKRYDYAGAIMTPAQVSDIDSKKPAKP